MNVIDGQHPVEYRRRVAPARSQRALARHRRPHTQAVACEEHKRNAGRPRPELAAGIKSQSVAGTPAAWRTDTHTTRMGDGAFGYPVLPVVFATTNAAAYSPTATCELYVRNAAGREVIQRTSGSRGVPALSIGATGNIAEGTGCSGKVAHPSCLRICVARRE